MLVHSVQTLFGSWCMYTHCVLGKGICANIVLSVRLYTGTCAQKFCTIVDGCTCAYVHSRYVMCTHIALYCRLVHVYTLYCIMLMQWGMYTCTGCIPYYCIVLYYGAKEHVYTSHIHCCVANLIHWCMCTQLVHYDEL